MKQFNFWAIVLILIGWFYWYEWRPTQIRKLCAEVTADAMKEFKPSLSHNDFKNYFHKDSFYKLCLRKHGLEK